jgi:hypothetical protein
MMIKKAIILLVIPLVSAKVRGVKSRKVVDTRRLGMGDMGGGDMGGGDMGGGSSPSGGCPDPEVSKRSPRPLLFSACFSF